MKTTKFNYFEWNNNILISALKKIDLSIVLIVALDALFYVLSGYIFIFWLQRIQAKMLAFGLPQDLTALPQEQLQQLAAEARNFLYILVFSFILALIAVIFLASIFKGIIWAKTTKTKITLHLISKFLGLNLIWMGFWIFVVFLIALFFRQESALIFMLVVTILGIYLTNTLYTIFMRKQQIKAIIEAIKLSFSKIHLFLLPYAVMFLIFFIIARASNLLAFKYSGVVFSLIMLAYIAVTRYYASTLVVEVGKL